MDKESPKEEQLPSNLAVSPIPPTRQWCIRNSQGALEPADDDRRHGLDAFITWLRTVATQAEKDRCILDPCYAKQKFAQWGSFYLEGDDPSADYKAIPAITVFRIYDSEHQGVPPRHRKKRDEQVVIIVNSQEDPGITATWRCTYSPYSTTGLAAKDRTRPRPLSIASAVSFASS